MKKKIISGLLALILSFSVWLPSPARAAGFSDTEQNWAKSSIEWALQAQLTNGYPDGTFRPDQAVTESEFLAMLVRYFPNAYAYLQNFPGNVGSWYAPYFSTGEHFHLPILDRNLANQPINRGEVARLITGALGHSYDEENAIAYLYTHNLANGRLSKTISGFVPAGTLTRAEAVRFFDNLHQQLSSREMLIRPAQQEALSASILEQYRSSFSELHIDHVVVVVEENHGYDQIIGSAQTPYINQLAKQGALFTDSHGVMHPSQPNYIALFSGSNQNVTSDSCPHTFTADNLAAQLQQAGLSFGGYSEDQPSTGFTGCWAGEYGRKHNPWADFSNVPKSVNMPLTELPQDFSKLPTVSYVIPNHMHDMHDGTIAQADNWLRDNMDSYVKWAAAHNSLLIVTWDEDDFSSSNHIATLFVGPMVHPGQYGQRINHYNVLSTLEDLYSLPRLGNTKTADSIRNIWQ